MFQITYKSSGRPQGDFRLSKIGFYSVVLFIIFSFIFKILLPFGDEPDFAVKAYGIKFGESLSALSLFPEDVAAALDLNTSCSIDSTPFSLTSSISGSGCNETIGQGTLRLIVTLITFSPILFALIFRNFFINHFYSQDASQQRMMARIRMDGLTVAIPFSGFIYYAGLLSNEQITLMLSSLALVFIDKKLFVLVLMSVAAIVDFGNAVVASSFFLAYFGIKFVYTYFGRQIVYTFLVISISFVSVAGVSILEYVPLDFGRFSDKASAMLWVLTEGSQADRVDKYPVFFRPILTCLSFVLYTPNYIKASLAYIYFFSFLAYCATKKVTSEYREFLTDLDCLLLSFVFTVLFYTLSFPTYANGKYYIFMLPIVFILVVARLGRRHSFIASVITTLLTVLSLALFRLS
jgi:hypothetical protein